MTIEEHATENREIAKIILSDKCSIMCYQKESNELVGIHLNCDITSHSLNEKSSPDAEKNFPLQLRARL